MLGNLKDMMGKLQEAQKQAEEVKAKLDDIHVKEEDAGISIIINGNRKIKDIVIDPALMEDVEELQDRLVISLNKAIVKAGDLHEKEMQSVARGMLPGTDLFK